MTESITDGITLLKDMYIHLPSYQNFNLIQILVDPYILWGEIYTLSQYY